MCVYIYIYICNNVKVFIVTFDQLNASLLNESIFKKLNKE